MSRKFLIVLLGLISLAGCIRLSEPKPVQPELAASAVASTAPQATATASYPWSDENTVMSGICFEAALDAVGTVFVLHNADEHIHFYEGVDNSHLCRHPVTRYPFDFSTGRVLAGLWSSGKGCTARHDVLGVLRDDTARQVTIALRFVTEGSCDYELVRPFWIGLDGVAGYDIRLVVQ